MAVTHSLPLSQIINYSLNLLSYGYQQLNIMAYEMI